MDFVNLDIRDLTVDPKAAGEALARFTGKPTRY